MGSFSILQAPDILKWMYCGHFFRWVLGGYHSGTSGVSWILRGFACMCLACWVWPYGISLSMSAQRNSPYHGNLPFITTSARASVVCELKTKQRCYYLKSHKGEECFNEKDWVGLMCASKCSLHALVVTVFNLVFQNRLWLKVATEILIGFKLKSSWTVIESCLMMWWVWRYNAGSGESLFPV